ncbi:MAG: hypothetical protein F6K00_01690 [Leptolyngbya sp. SIOISBB]|nr:hypothetical protein [Leptolyngbya sp. SIOISBB]
MFKQLFVSLGAVSILTMSAAIAPAADDIETELASVESAALGIDSDLPWSEIVQINDPFEGSFVGVFDRHSFFGRLLNTSVRVEVQSLWTRDYIRVLSIVRDRDCLSQPAGVAISPRCSEFNNARNITRLLIKIEDDVIEMTGQGSTFSVSDRVAAALQSAPDEVIKIRLISENGETIDSEIGKGTVEAWKTIYGVEAIAGCYPDQSQSQSQSQS